MSHGLSGIHDRKEVAHLLTSGGDGAEAECCRGDGCYATPFLQYGDEGQI